MPLEVRLLPDEPIIHVTISSPFTIKEGIPALAAEINKIIETHEGPLWDVTDVTNLSVPFGDMVSGTAALTKGDLAILQNPKFKKFAIVTTNRPMKMVASALTQFQYGGLSASVVDTLEEAFAIIRKDIKESAK